MPVTFLDPGQLTARLDLETPMPVPDGQGGASAGFETMASLWAKIEPVSLYVRERAGGENVAFSHRIWLRHRGGIAAGMRFRKGARLFFIRAVHDPDETARYLVCHCEEDSR